MKTLLVLGKASALAAAIREGLDPDHFRVIAKDEVWEAEPLLRRGAFDACILDAELTDIQPIRIVKQLLRLMPTCPVIIYSSSKQWEWEEEAYLLGVNHILSKPPRIRLLNALLDRLGPQPPAAPTAPLREPRASESSQRPVRALEVLRDFSAILTHSLFTDALLKQFLLMLREILGVNRAAIFLRRPPAALRALPVDKDESRLRPACAIGLPPDLLDYFELTLEAGIGRYVYRAGRVLKNGSDEARADLEIQKEFELLGAHVAIPILDRESLVGVAVFDGRLTGEFFANEELALIFHLLEGLGLAIKNSWLHDQLAVSHELMGDILSHLASACVVVDRNLNVLHANEAALAYFHKPERRSRALEFGDLPQILGGKVFEALNAGAELPAFKYQPPNAPERLCQATVTPFKTRRSRAADAVLLLIEDITDRERSRQLELESAGLRLIKKMAERMAHEIGNSLVPITTSHQLGEQDPKLRASISAAVAESVRRISRLTQ
ncbi:MAG: response regulator, partial [Verrucomicrobia bacterium]|nr:response regulator [Verrucomicrobiota bacterium]